MVQSLLLFDQSMISRRGAAALSRATRGRYHAGCKNAERSRPPSLTR